MSDVTVTFGAKDEGLKHAISTAEKGAASLKSAFVALGASAALIGSAKIAFDAFKGMADYAGSVADLTAQTGLSAESVMVWGQALKNAGLSADSLQSLMNRLQKAMTGVNAEGEPTNKAFEKLGLSVEVLRSQSPERQLETMRESISGIADPAERAAIAMELFGKGGGKALSLLTDSSAISTARKQVGDLAETLGENLATLDKFSDALNAAGEIKTMQFMAGFAKELAGNLNSAADTLNEMDASEAGKKTASFLRSIFGTPESAMEVLVRKTREQREAADKERNQNKGKGFEDRLEGRMGRAEKERLGLGSSLGINTQKVSLDQKELDILKDSTGVLERKAELFPQIVSDAKDLTKQTDAFATSLGTGFFQLESSLETTESIEASKKRQLETEKESLKTQISIAQEQKTAAQEALSAANNQLQTIAGADPQGLQPTAVKARGVGMRATKIKNAEKALKYQAIADEEEALFPGSARAKRLAKQAEEFRAKATGGVDKVGQAEKSLASIDRNIQELNKKLPTPALAQ